MPSRREPAKAATQPRLGPPPKLRRVLVPLDGSRLAEASLPIVARLADLSGATIVLLHVLERRGATTVHGERHLSGPDEAAAYLAGVAARLQRQGAQGSARQTECHTHDVPVADVAESIAVHAEEHAIDMVVLSTHGESGIRDALWGSIAQQVAQRLTCPVLLVRVPPGAEPPATEFDPRTIMVPLDGTLAAEAALPHALALAGGLNASLRLVFVVPTVDTVSVEQMASATFMPGASRLVLDVAEEQAHQYLAGLTAVTSARGVRTIPEVRRGEAVTQLATDAGEHADGLVVIATHGRAGLQAIWSRSVAARLLRRTDAPILLVPIIE